MALTDGTMIKKHNVLFFVNAGTSVSPDWVRIRKSTDSTISNNPETQEFDYIDAESPTTELDRVKPSLSQPVTMYKGNPDFEYFYNKFFNQSVGDDAHTEILVVFFYGSDTSAYDAWKSDAVVLIDSMNAVDSVLTANINFNGTTNKGTVVVTDGVPVFTSATQTEFIMTFTATVSAVAEEGATIQCGGVTKLTDASGQATFTLIDGETYTVGVTNGTEEYSDIFEADTATATMALPMV